jgi:hypothetical protein
MDVILPDDDKDDDDDVWLDRNYNNAVDYKIYSLYAFVNT